MSDQLNFNLKLYRERLTDKYSRNNSNSIIGQDNLLSSQRKSFKKNAPTLDSISSRLQNHSSNKLKTDSRVCSPKNLSSPVTLNGMQQKIKSITTSPQQFVNNNFGHPISSPKSVVTHFQGFYQSPRAQTDRNEIQQIKRYNSNNDITEMIPFHDLVNMRNKLENYDINAAHISPTYLSEIVKLAHVINTQLQKK
ncbi:unnamed protein product [Paramecium pentaurelia]|uniref:Uncharacterized protein n=1 Tax=Paramecium pentaurelia TaxID=43138 RepID=A0A8S1TWZ2_9CILI|nr:unnamed protein product [Paramecium pentaurelia]